MFWRVTCKKKDGLIVSKEGKKYIDSINRYSQKERIYKSNRKAKFLQEPVNQTSFLRG